jgi:hypothetical protein
MSRTSCLLKDNVNWLFIIVYGNGFLQENQGKSSLNHTFCRIIAPTDAGKCIVAS